MGCCVSKGQVSRTVIESPDGSPAAESSSNVREARHRPGIEGLSPRSRSSDSEPQTPRIRSQRGLEQHLQKQFVRQQTSYMDTQQHWEDSQQWGEITQAGDSPDSWRTASMASAMAESSAMAALREVEHQGAGIHEQAEPWWSAQNVLPAIQTGASAIASAGVDILSTVGPYQGTRMLVKAVYPGASEALSSSVFFGGRAALQSIKRMHEAIKKRAADNQARAMAVSDAMDMLAGFDEANSLPHMQEHCKVQICAHLADYVQGSTVSSAVNDAIESANADPLAIIRNLEWQVTQHHVLSNRRS